MEARTSPSGSSGSVDREISSLKKHRLEFEKGATLLKVTLLIFTSRALSSMYWRSVFPRLPLNTQFWRRLLLR